MDYNRHIRQSLVTGLDYSLNDSATTGNLHPQDRDAGWLSLGKNLFEFFFVDIKIVQLGTTNHYGTAGQIT